MKTEDNLHVEVAENGFVVYERAGCNSASLTKMWAFETAESLSRAILEWGDGNTKVKTQPINSGSGAA